MQGNKNKTIFIIEDEDFLVKAYTYIFEREGYSVWVAHDGDEALKFLPKTPPDCILLDVMLPKKDGFQVMRDFSKDPRWKAIPVVILSNLGKQEDLDMGKGLGARDYLVKANIDIDHILKTVKGFVEK